jgi:phospholipid-binding lipoprotein MlaA
MRVSRRRVQLLLASVAAAQAVAAPAFAQNEPYDPWEGFNRKMYAIHEVLDRAVFGPVARTFGRMPRPIRQGLVNFSTNLSEPVVFVNDMLQGRVKTAAGTVGRFVMNSTVGVAGFRDVAKHNHLPHHDNGFGITLGRWGADPGPYMFIPFIGPSDLRDTIGVIGQIFLNPFYYVRFEGKTALTVSTGVIDGLEVRLEAEPALANIQATSTDPYATLRSYFLQNREAAIKGTTEPEALPEFDMPDIPPDSGAAPSGSAPPEAAPSGAEPQAAPSGGAPATPAPEAAPSEAAPVAAPAPAAGPGPKWLIAPDADQPMLTAGGR